MKEFIGFICQKITPETIRRYMKLQREKCQSQDLYWLISEGSWKGDLPEDIQFIILPNNESLKRKYRKINYSGEWELQDPYNGWHFNVVLFFIEAYLKNSLYDYYWFIEFDVFMKDFHELFLGYQDSKDDVLASNICKHQLTCNISYYNNKYNLIDYPTQYKGFFVICRLSKRILEDLVKYYLQDKYFGFFESIIMMITIEKGYSFECFSVKKFIGGSRNRIGNLSTVSWDKEFIYGWLDKLINSDKNYIIHPIKLDKNIDDCTEE